MKTASKIFQKRLSGCSKCCSELVNGSEVSLKKITEIITPL